MNPSYSFKSCLKAQGIKYRGNLFIPYFIVKSKRVETKKRVRKMLKNAFLKTQSKRKK